MICSEATKYQPTINSAFSNEMVSTCGHSCETYRRPERGLMCYAILYFGLKSCVHELRL